MLFLGWSVAWPETRVRRVMSPMLRLDLPPRVIVICWSVRGPLIAVGVLGLSRPHAAAAAWTEWTARRAATGAADER
jgi:hypothetical protein